MNDWLVGLIRTLAQAAAGALLTWLVSRGIELDEEPVVVVLFALFTGIYREVVTLLAKRWPALEWLNGWKAQPQYVDPSTGRG